MKYMQSNMNSFILTTITRENPQFTKKRKSTGFYSKTSQKNHLSTIYRFKFQTNLSTNFQQNFKYHGTQAIQTINNG